MASLGSLVIELSANTARLQSDMSRAISIAERGAQRLNSAFRFLAGGIGAATFTELIGSSIKFGDELSKAAQKTGTSAKAISELAFVARQSDIDLTSLTTGLKKMQVTLSEAGSGSKAAQTTLAALGLTFQQLNQLKPDQQFEAIADAISRLKDPADKTRAAVEIFGRAGADLLPAMNDGARGIAALRKEAQQLGKSLDDKSLANLKQADEAFKKMRESASSLADTLAIKLGPSIAKFFDIVRQASGGASSIENLKTELQLAEQAAARMAERNPASAQAAKDRAAQIRNQLRLLTNSRQPAPITAGTGEAPGFAAATADADTKAAKQHYDDLYGYEQEFAKTQQDVFQEAIIRNNQYFNNLTKKLNKDAKEQINEIDEFAKQAARNMQDAFAQFLFDPFKGGLKGMLHDFINVVRQMVAQAAAAKIFASKKQGGLGLGDFLSNLFGTALGGSGGKGGARAFGGPVMAGQSYLVGERGPEIFTPSTSGNVGGGSMTINIDARGADPGVEAKIAAVIPIAIRAARADRYNDRRRGR